jgi:hypothetical protein
VAYALGATVGTSSQVGEQGTARGERLAKPLARVSSACKGSAQNFCTGESLRITTTSCGRSLKNTQVVRFFVVTCAARGI